MLSFLYKVFKIATLINDVCLILKEVRRQTPRYTPEAREEIKRKYKEVIRC